MIRWKGALCERSNREDRRKQRKSISLLISRHEPADLALLLVTHASIPFINRRKASPPNLLSNHIIPNPLPSPSSVSTPVCIFTVPRNDLSCGGGGDMFSPPRISVSCGFGSIGLHADCTPKFGPGSRSRFRI
jgi:hypothetical protein